VVPVQLYFRKENYDYIYIIDITQLERSPLMSTNKHICFDRIIPGDLRRAIRFGSVGGGRTRAITPLGKLWINGSSLSIGFMGGTTEQHNTEENTTLSEIDKAFIAGKKMYPGKASPLVELPILELKATEASIGQPGEEDLFVFNAQSAGGIKIETEGQTDLVMKLFGPDSQTQLIAEDDDSGQGYNPKINVDLAQGKYYVQIRHYNRTAGTGSYGIKVSKY